MLKLIVTSVSLFAVGASPLAQELWDQVDLVPGGMEYSLTNEDGAKIILVCQTDGIVAGFEFPDSLDNPGRASVRAIPGQRQNVPLTPVTDRIVRITGLTGTTFMLALLREAPRMHVRIAGASTIFRTEGSSHIVSGCFERQEDLPGGNTPAGVAPLPSPFVPDPSFLPGVRAREDRGHPRPAGGRQPS